MRFKEYITAEGQVIDGNKRFVQKISQDTKKSTAAMIDAIDNAAQDIDWKIKEAEAAMNKELKHLRLRIARVAKDHPDASIPEIIGLEGGNPDEDPHFHEVEKFVDEHYDEIAVALTKYEAALDAIKHDVESNKYKPFREDDLYLTKLPVKLGYVKRMMWPTLKALKEKTYA